MVDLKDVFAAPEKYAGQIEVEGWIRNNRGSNKFGFIELNDGTYFKSVQVVYEEEFLDHEWASVYQIQSPDLASAIGSRIFIFPFSYSGGTTLQDGFLMNCPAGLFLFAGSPVDFTPVSLGEEAVIDEAEEEVVDDIDELDFSMI